MSVRRAARWALDSPTAMTWTAMGTGAIRFFVVLPLVLQRFAAPDVAVWFLMLAFLQFQSMLDFGFTATGARYFAYASGGATDFERPADSAGSRNLAGLASVYASLRTIYPLLAVATGAAVALLGIWFLTPAVNATSDPMAAWSAWVIMIAGATVSFSFLAHPTLLLGTNHVAIVRRWEALGNVASAASMVAALAAGGGLLALALTMQAWNLVVVLRNAVLSHGLLPEVFREIPRVARDAQAIRSIWSKAWRSGLGLVLDSGIVRLSAGWIALVVAPLQVATYLLAFQILERLSHFSTAPFYAHLPSYGRMFSENRHSEMLTSARRAIFSSTAILALLGLALGVLAQAYIEIIGTSTPFAGWLIWGLVLAAMLLQRIGAMHLQLYTLSNHIMWHKVTAGSGLVYVAAFWALTPAIGIVGTAIALLLGAGVYTTYCLAKSIPWQRSLGHGVAHGD